MNLDEPTFGGMSRSNRSFLYFFPWLGGGSCREQIIFDCIELETWSLSDAILLLVLGVEASQTRYRQQFGPKRLKSDDSIDVDLCRKFLVLCRSMSKVFGLVSICVETIFG